MTPISPAARRVLRNIRDGKPHEEGLTAFQMPHFDRMLDALAVRNLIDASLNITETGKEYLTKYEN